MHRLARDNSNYSRRILFIILLLAFGIIFFISPAEKTFTTKTNNKTVIDVHIWSEEDILLYGFKNVNAIVNEAENYPIQTAEPTLEPTVEPTPVPTEEPTPTPTVTPTALPSRESEEIEWLTCLCTTYTASEENGSGQTGCRDNPLTLKSAATNISNTKQTCSDLPSLPFGTVIYIEGVGEKVIEDNTSHYNIDHNIIPLMENTFDRSPSNTYWFDIYIGESNNQWCGVRKFYIVKLG